MTTRTTTVLKTYFNTGDKPTETNFHDMLESYLNITDGGTTQTVSDGNTITFAAGEGIDLSESSALEEFQQEVIDTMEKLCQD